MEEVASAARDDIASAWIGELREFQDDILRMLPTELAAYKKLLTDYQVQSTLQQRFDAVIEKDYEVSPGGTSKADVMAAEFMEEVLEHVKWNRVTRRMLYGVFYGYAVAELLHARDGRLVFPDQIRVRDRSRFRFDNDFDLRLITRDNPRGELMPDRKFWWFATGADHDDDPYGLGLAHFLYWPVYFKRHGVRFWLVFLEKFAQPTPIGKYQPGTPKPEQKKLLQALAALTTDSAIIMPEGMSVDKFEALRTGTNSYEPFIDKMDAAIAKINLSQTMTTDDGSSRSQAEVHEGVRDAVIKTDSELIDESFTRHPVRWYTQWNFPGAEPPIVQRRLVEEEDLESIAERDEKIFSFGYRPTPERVQDVYGEGYEAVSSGLPVAEFTERLDEAVQALSERADETMLDVLIDPIRQLLEESSSLEDFRDRMADEFSEMDADTLGNMLMRAMLVAELSGRYEVQEGE